MDMPFGGSDDEDSGAREMRIPASAPAPGPAPKAAPKKPAASTAQRKPREARPPVKAGKADLRPTCFDPGAPDTQGSYTSPCEKFWMGDTCISEVEMKRFPGETTWTARTAMLTAPDLTFRDPNSAFSRISSACKYQEMSLHHLISSLSPLQLKHRAPHFTARVHRQGHCTKHYQADGRQDRWWR